MSEWLDLVDERGLAGALLFGLLWALWRARGVLIVREHHEQVVEILSTQRDAALAEARAWRAIALQAQGVAADAIATLPRTPGPGRPSGSSPS